MNVLVYSGPEASPTSLSHSLTTLRSLLLPNYTVQIISPQSLASHPWAATTAILVFPACRNHLSPTPPLSAAIRSYVEDGGSLLAFSASARVQRPRTLDTGFANLSLSGERSLRFHDRASDVYLYPKFQAGDDSSASTTTVRLIDGASIKCILQSGNPDFSGTEDEQCVEVLARFLDGDDDSAVAAVSCRIGEGRAVFSGPHLEYSLEEQFASAVLSKASPALSPQDIQDAEAQRVKFLRAILEKLGLQLPVRESSTPSRPLPLFLSGEPQKPHITSQILSALSVPSLNSSPFELKDSSDTFKFHAISETEAVLVDARKQSYHDAEPSISQLPKQVIVCSDGKLPTRDQTALFNLHEYYTALSLARKDAGCPEDADPWGMGEAMLYGEVVTSTQTMLDRNTRLLSLLPTPLLALASRQLAGRGRGANVWLSPAGCLQFSLLLRVPLTALPGARIVFVQYLFALAVVEACRDEMVLGAAGARVRLKWPNDLYAVLDDGEKKKIGGILVNTSFSSGKVELVVGCGLNVLNPPPITSLSQLLHRREDRLLSMERTAAVIMAKFERMWGTFLAHRGSFEPFMDIYLEHWLHSDQMVTLTTTTPPQKVRITGITSDYGLLRTVPERDGWSGSRGPEFIDLQPDGNSFDLMAGLIKTKT